MNFNLGFKALAYPALNSLDPVSPCQCSVVFRSHDRFKQATLLLVARLPTALDTQAFVLQYDADKLLSGTVSLTSGNARIPRPQLEELLRNRDSKQFEIKTLALCTEQSSPLWCPDTPSFSPKPGCELVFKHFVELTKATAIHIVFDYKHVHKNQQGMFKAFSKAASGLTGYPVAASLANQNLRSRSWGVFGPVDAVDAPPAYDSCLKRPRQASSNSPTRSPKRFAPQSPTDSCSSGTTVPFSPTTANELLQRALRKASPEFNSQAQAINAAIDKHLPTHLEKTLRALLPDMLEGLFADQSISSSPATSFDSRGNRHTKLPPLTPLGKRLIPHLRSHLTDQFQQHQAHQLQRFEKLVDEKLAKLEDDAYEARALENAEMMEEMEEHKSEMLLLKDDAIKDLLREVDHVFVRSKEEGWSLGHDINEQLTELCDKIEQVKSVELRKMVAREVKRQERRRKGALRGVVKKGLVRGDKRLLGRRREAEDIEWVDCGDVVCESIISRAI